MALSRHWLCLCSFWPLILHCHDKVAKCRDIRAAFMFPFFVVSLSQQYRLAFFLSDCRDKLFKCHNKVSVYASSLFSIIVATMKGILRQCSLPSPQIVSRHTLEMSRQGPVDSFSKLSRQGFLSRNIILLPCIVDL